MSTEEQFDFYWKEIFDGLPYNPIEFNVYRFDQSMSLPSKFNKLYDMFKQLALNNQEVMDYLKEFVETFDFKLETTIKDILIVWLNEGLLADVVREVISEEVIEARTDYLGKQYIDLKERLDEEKKFVDLWIDERLYYVKQSDPLTKIQSILNQGKSIYFPSGINYLLNDTLTLGVDGIGIFISSGATITVSFHDKNAFHVVGNNCKIVGAGKIVNPKFWLPSTTWSHAIVYVSGNECLLKDFQVINVSTVCVGLKDVNYVTIENLHIKGNLISNPTGNTTHMGVCVDPTNIYPQGNISINNCTIEGCVEGVYVGALGTGLAHLINISNNTFIDCFDHGVYIGIGSIGSIVNGNSFLNCSSPVAITGENHVVTNNTMLYSEGGIINDYGASIAGRNCVGCIVQNNSIKMPVTYKKIAIDFIVLGTNNKIENNIISNNFIDTGKNHCIAIRVSNTSGTPVTKNNIISNNIIKTSASETFGVITFSGGNANKPSLQNKIKDNTIQLVGGEGLAYCIYIRYEQYGVIENNVIDINFNSDVALNLRVIHLFQCDNLILNQNLITCLEGFGLNLSMIGVYETGSTITNQIKNNNITLISSLLTSAITYAISSLESKTKISSDSMFGSATIPGGANKIVVTNKNITTKSRLVITASNPEAGKKPCYYSVSNGSFTIFISDGVNVNIDANYVWTII